tara:strand:- start:23 stop:634 length:612 start_codon:yes stop_codon:yes gene_type:complete
MPSQNKNGVNPTTGQPQSVKVGEHKTTQDNKNVVSCKSLNEAMTKFQQLAVKATKDSSNPFFKSTYADLSAVIGAVGEAAQYGLSFTQIVNYDNTILTDGEYKQYMHRDFYVETIVTHNIDEKTLTSRIPIIVSENKKSDPQAMGSAITYVKRYALQAIYGLATEDDDGNSAKSFNTDPNTGIRNIGTISNKTSDTKSSRGGF